MSLVLDASVTIAWVYAAERTDAVVHVFERVTRERVWVPTIWHLEVANVLQLNVLRGKYDVAFRNATLLDLRAFRILTDAETEQHAWTSTLQLAEQYRLTAYDAAYLELAKRRRCELATLDRELRRAAEAEGVPLLGL